MLQADKTSPGLKSADQFFEQEMVNLEELHLEIELASFLGDDNGWDASNILDNIGTPSPFNSPYADLHEPNSTSEEQQQADLDSCTSKTLPTNENEELVIEQTADQICVHDSKGSIIATRNQVQTIQPISNQENFSNSENPVAPTPFVDDPNLPPQPLVNCSTLLLNETPTHSSSSAVELISKVTGSSLQHQDMTTMGCFYQFSHMQNENLNMREVLGIPYHQSICNPLLMPNIVASNNFSGINNHSSPYPALFYTYPVEARGGIGIGHSSGQFITNQRSVLQNNIIPHIALISGLPVHNQFPTPNLYDSHYGPNYLQYESSTSYRQPNSFTPLPHQDGHAIGMHKIYDLQYQNYLQAAYSTYPKPEPLVHLHPAFVPVPSNPHHAHQQGYNGPTAFVPLPPSNLHAHQHGYNRTTLPEPAVPSVPPLVYPDYHPQPRPNPTTYNFFGPGSSSMQPPTYPASYDNQNNNHYNPQATMPGGHLQQGVGSWQLAVPQRVPDHQMNAGNNGLLNTPNIQRLSHPLHEPAAPATTSHSASQAQCSRNLQGLPGTTTRTTEGSSSQGSNSSTPDEFARLISFLRPERASGVQEEQVTPISRNVVTNQRDKGKLPMPSTTRQPSEAIRRILDMTPRRTVTRTPQQNQSLNISTGRREGAWIPNLEMQLASNGPIAAPRRNGPIAAPPKVTAVAEQAQNEKKRRGRPPKRRGPIDTASSSKHQKRGPTKSPEADETPEIVKKEDETANPAGPSSASSECFNANRLFCKTLYDPAYEKIGLPVDPTLRFQALLGKYKAPWLLGERV